MPVGIAFGQVERKGAVIAVLRRAVGYIRGELGRRLTLRFVPALTFQFDDSLDRQERILSLIDEIHHDEEDRFSEDDSSDEGSY